MKAYLTLDLIQLVQRKAADPIWRMGIFAGSHQNWFSILKISPIGLIHIYGNRDTGWAHIISRHSYYSDDLYFGDGSLGNPSRFQSATTAIFDWVRIADDVFNNGQVDEREHPDAAQFIKYTGRSANYEGANGKELDFILILYRDTKIVHSLFPKKDMVPAGKRSKLKQFKRSISDATASTTYWYDFLTITIFYLNSELTARYLIIVHIDLETMKAKLHLQANWPDGKPCYCISELMAFSVDVRKEDVETNNIEFIRFFNSFIKFTDFSQIEKIMLDIEKESFPQDSKNDN